MTQNLYDVLGVERDADQAEIRRAYRRAAKKAHPDAGGSTEDFALVTLAHDCLGDEKRRKRYDDTGEIGGKKPENKQAEELEMALQAIAAVANQVFAAPVGVAELDVLEHARVALRNSKAQEEQTARANRNQAEKWEKLARRFKAKQGKHNRISPMLEQQAIGLRRQATQHEDRADLIGRAITVLEDHDFEIEKVDIPPAFFYSTWGR